LTHVGTALEQRRRQSGGRERRRWKLAHVAGRDLHVEDRGEKTELMHCHGALPLQILDLR
jgi:hypothetical protein